jgi:predicted transcriptional regulator
MKVLALAAGYTPGMKTAVSVPDDLFARADQFAKYTQRSRSEVYSSALREYLARHEADAVTAAMNRVLAEDPEEGPDPFLRAAAREVFRNTEW